MTVLSQSRAVFHFGEYTVRCDTREVTRHGELIRLERVTKRFGDHTVLDNLDFSVDAGKHVTLIGPSGGGKTTLCRAFWLLLP